jgi:hypothetical protein
MGFSTMKKATATDVKNRFDDYLDEARSEPVVVNRKDRSVGAIELG